MPHVCVCVEPDVGVGCGRVMMERKLFKEQNKNTPIKKVSKGGIFGATNIYFRQFT